MTATGKWRQPGVPHKDWTCVDIEDLGSPDHVCEMCDVQDVRYVYVMEHANYAETCEPPSKLHCADGSI